MNEHVLRGMPGEEHVLFRADSIAPGDDSAANYPIEFLNSLNLPARDQAQGPPEPQSALRPLQWHPPHHHRHPRPPPRGCHHHRRVHRSQNHQTSHKPPAPRFPFSLYAPTAPVPSARRHCHDHQQVTRPVARAPRPLPSPARLQPRAALHRLLTLGIPPIRWQGRSRRCCRGGGRPRQPQRPRRGVFTRNAVYREVLAG